MDKAEKNGKKKKLLDVEELNDKIQNEELLTSWINLNKTVKTKLKFRTISELTKRFYVERKQNNYGVDKLSEKQDNYPMMKKQTGQTRRY
jgi:hypothetical protein